MEHRTALLLILFADKGYVLGNSGVRNKKTNKIVAETPEEIAKVLSKAYEIPFTQEVLSSYKNMQKFLEDSLDEEKLNELYDKYLRCLDRCTCDVPQDLENYWLDNQERLKLTGKNLPASSKLYPFREM